VTADEVEHRKRRSTLAIKWSLADDRFAVLGQLAIVTRVSRSERTKNN
jgi:hypothetical protein